MTKDFWKWHKKKEEINRKRLAMKIATMDKGTFQALTIAVVKVCFPNITL